MAYIGNTIRLRASFYNFSDVLTDPTAITLKFYDQKRVQIGSDISITVANKVSTGIYEYDYTIPNTTSSAIVYEWRGLISGEVSLARGVIPLRWA